MAADQLTHNNHTFNINDNEKDSNDARSRPLLHNDHHCIHRVPSAQAHANLYNGAGYYKNEVLIPSNINLNQLAPNIKSLLHLNYGGKQAQKLEIRKLNNSTLEMTNYNGDIFRFSR